MTIKKDKFVAARKASGMNLEEATKATGVKSISTYVSHEDNPEMFRLGELKGLHSEMSDIAKPLLENAICDIFLSG